MTVWTTLKTAASSAASTVYNAASGFNNLGTGNTKDPSSHRYEGRLNGRSVKEEVGKPNCTYPPIVPPPSCPNGFYDYGNGRVESCPATSKEIAPDGCSFEGRYAQCHNLTTGNWDYDLYNCAPNDYFRLYPPCPEKVCVALPEWQQVGLAVVAAGGLIYGAKKVIIVGRNIYEKCKAAYQAFWETPTSHSNSSSGVELDSLEQGLLENREADTPETSFNTPS